MDAIAVTNHDWFRQLRDDEPKEPINFWTPTPWSVKQVEPGDRWYFMLPAPIRKVGGFGIFRERLVLPASEAWRRYGPRNGVRSQEELIARISDYVSRRASAEPTADPEIGCLLLENPDFWPDQEFREPETVGTSFPDQVVTFKYIRTDDSTKAEARVSDVERTAAESAESAIEAGASDGQGFTSDPLVKKAVEDYAMRCATRYFEAMGFRVEDKSGNHPFDLLCEKDGKAVHVEVKGTRTMGEKVILTQGEVEHAQDPAHEMALYVQRNVKVKVMDGIASASGGTTDVKWPWILDPDRLRPITLFYSVE